ncbi:MAG: c-type cytochrome domain-containing protein [Bdellovibrionota bacterium]
MGTFNGIVLTLFSLLTLVSCNYRHEKVSQFSGGDFSFAAVQKFVLQPKCLSCHAGAASPQGVNLSSYDAMMGSNVVTPFKPEASRIYDSLAAARMPKGQPALSPRLLELVRVWIENGAQEGSAPPPPPQIQPTYDSISENIFQKRCNGCHNGAHADTELDLRTYKSLMEFEGDFLKAVDPKDPDSSSLYLNLANEIMPPPGPLEEKEITAVRDWILAGAKEKEKK